MLFDLNKARRYFNEDVRFGEVTPEIKKIRKDRAECIKFALDYAEKAADATAKASTYIDNVYEWLKSARNYTQDIPAHYPFHQDLEKFVQQLNELNRKFKQENVKTLKNVLKTTKEFKKRSDSLSNPNFTAE